MLFGGPRKGARNSQAGRAPVALCTGTARACGPVLPCCRPSHGWLDPAGLEELQQQRASLLAAAREEESERAQLAANLATLQRRLGQLDASLEKKAAAKVWRSLGQLANSCIPLLF